MSKSANGRALFERLRTGLEEGIQFARDELPLRTTEVPAPSRPAAAGSAALAATAQHVARGVRPHVECVAQDRAKLGARRAQTIAGGAATPANPSGQAGSGLPGRRYPCGRGGLTTAAPFFGDEQAYFDANRGGDPADSPILQSYDKQRLTILS